MAKRSVKAVAGEASKPYPRLTTRRRTAEDLEAKAPASTRAQPLDGEEPAAMRKRRKAVFMDESQDLHVGSTVVKPNESSPMRAHEGQDRMVRSPETAASSPPNRCGRITSPYEAPLPTFVPSWSATENGTKADDFWRYSKNVRASRCIGMELLVLARTRPSLDGERLARDLQDALDMKIDPTLREAVVVLVESLALPSTRNELLPSHARDINEIVDVLSVLRMAQVYEQECAATIPLPEQRLPPDGDALTGAACAEAIARVKKIVQLVAQVTPAEWSFTLRNIARGIERILSSPPTSDSTDRTVQHRIKYQCHLLFFLNTVTDQVNAATGSAHRHLDAAKEMAWSDLRYKIPIMTRRLADVFERETTRWETAQAQLQASDASSVSLAARDHVFHATIHDAHGRIIRIARHQEYLWSGNLQLLPPELVELVRDEYGTLGAALRSVTKKEMRWCMSLLELDNSPVPANRLHSVGAVVYAHVQGAEDRSYYRCVVLQALRSGKCQVQFEDGGQRAIAVEHLLSAEQMAAVTAQEEKSASWCAIM